MPMPIPHARPENRRTGKYKKSLGVSIMAAATDSCARLWITPPAILTPIMLNLSVDFNKYINKRLLIPPANEYMAPNNPVKRSAEIAILIKLTDIAVLKSDSYKITNITRFAIPSFMPGIPIGIGIIDSTYEKIIARHANRAICVIEKVLL